jgi:hypothetical protein
MIRAPSRTQFLVPFVIAAGLACGSDGLAEPPPVRWTAERLSAASSSELNEGVPPVLREVTTLRKGLIARASATTPGPGELRTALLLLTQLRSPEAARACLSRLDVTSPVPGIRSMDDEEWRWPARKALTEMGWAVVPEILAWIEVEDRSASDLQTVGGILRDILGPEIGVAVLEAHRARRASYPQLVERLAAANSILTAAIRTPSTFPWR